MLSLVPPVTPCQRHGVSFSDVLETDELQMIPAAYVNSPGTAEESPFDLFPPSSSSALQLTLADGRASFVPGSSFMPAPGALPRGLGPPGLPLVYASLHTHLLKQANSPPANMGYGIDCVSCSYISFTKEVSLLNTQVCFEVSCLSLEVACCHCDTTITERAARQKHVHKDTREVP